MLIAQQKYVKRKQEEITLLDTKKMYNGHAKEFNDPIEGPIIRQRENIASKMNEW